MLAAGTCNRDCDTADENECLRNGDCYNWLDNVVVALADGAIRVGRVIRVDVGELKSSAEYQQNGDERNDEMPHPLGSKPEFAILRHTSTSI